MLVNKMIRFLKYDSTTLCWVLSQVHFTQRDYHPALGGKNLVSLFMMYLFFYFLKSSSKNLSVSFSAISLFETWCESQEEAQNSNDILLGYSFFISIGNIAEEEVCLIVKQSF